MAHRNARLTPLTRLELVREVDAGWPQAEVARHFRVSRHTVAKWLGRFRAEGAQGSRTAWSDASAPCDARAAPAHLVRTSTASIWSTYTSLDDHSRYAYVSVLPDELEALAAFRRRGVRVRRVLTDNAKAYTVARAAAAADVRLSAAELIQIRVGLPLPLQSPPTACEQPSCTPSLSRDPRDGGRDEGLQSSPAVMRPAHLGGLERALEPCSRSRSTLACSHGEKTRR